MQRLVDFRGIFKDVYIYIGWPGKAHDAEILANSAVFKCRNEGTPFPDWEKNISGVQVILIVYLIMNHYLILIYQVATVSNPK